MIAAAFAAGMLAALLALGALRAFRGAIARARTGNFPRGYVDRVICEATPDKHVAMTVIGVDGSSTRHVFHALHAHGASSSLLVASAKARDPRNGEMPDEAA